MPFLRPFLKPSMALLPEQIPVASGRASSWRVLDELADGTSQFAGLVFGDEGVAVGDLDQLPMWEQLSKSPPVLSGIDAVFRCPVHERRTVKVAEVFSCGEHVPLVEGLHVLGEIAADPPLGLQWAQPGVDNLIGNRSLRHPAKGERQAAQGVHAQELRHEEGSSRYLDTDLCGPSGQTRWEVLEGFAGSEHQSRDALRIQASSELKNARVVSHQGHLAQFQGF